MQRLSHMHLAVLAAALLVSTGLAEAADLTIGSSTEPQAIDPHFSRLNNSQVTAQHIFDRLVVLDQNLQIRPGLAESWTNPDENTWEIKLREGVTFHDGSPLTSEDVIFSFERADEIPNSPSPFTPNVAFIESMELVDPLTVRFTTDRPVPQFLDLAGTLFIVSKAAAEGKSVEDFNSGDASIGTGPYKFVSWTPGDRLVLQRNEDYWGEKPFYENVIFRLISNAAARVAAIRSRAVDLIDAVPPSDLETLEGVDGITLHSSASGRIVYLALDSDRVESPFIVGPDGRLLNPNPLKDVRVREAISKMIDRPLLIDRILNGAGVPAAQLVPEGIIGYSEALLPEAFDPEGAKELLREAGYPDGFGITIHSSNDRFPGDGDIAQALGQLFARGGLQVNGVQTQPYNVYVGNAGNQEFSAFIFTFGTTTPSSMPAMTNVLMTYDPDAGTGAFNRTRYSHPVYDAKMLEASVEFDPETRARLLTEAAEIAFADYGVIPIYWPTNTWASREGIEFVANLAEYTLATFARGQE